MDTLQQQGGRRNTGSGNSPTYCSVGILFPYQHSSYSMLAGGYVSVDVVDDPFIAVSFGCVIAWVAGIHSATNALRKGMK